MMITSSKKRRSSTERASPEGDSQLKHSKKARLQSNQPRTVAVPKKKKKSVVGDAGGDLIGWPQLVATETGGSSWEKAVATARGLPDGDAATATLTPQHAPKATKTKTKTADDKTPDGKKSSKMKKSAATKGKGGKLKKSKGEDKEKESEDGGKENKKQKAKKRKSSDKENDKDDDMCKKERKRLRQMKKPHYEMSMKAKALWETLRRSQLDVEKRTQVCNSMHDLVKGQANQLIFAHDTSRVLQCLAKYGTKEQRSSLFEELREQIIPMMKSQYAKFIVRKMLKYGTKAQRNYIFCCLHGNVRRLIRDKNAAEILEYAYNIHATTHQRTNLVQEFYGPSFALFKTEQLRTLDQIMTSHPDKKVSILSNLKEALSSLVNKSVLQYSLVHRVFREFFLYASTKQRAEMIETVRSEVIHMLHTKDGVLVTMHCIWHGTAKDRKVIMKSFKSYVVKICTEEFGHLALLAMFDSVDDTKILQKIILDEMLKSVGEVATNMYGRKVLLYLLRPHDPVHFHPDIVKLLAMGDDNLTSKKMSVLRSSELLAHVSRPLIRYVADHCDTLVTNNATLLLLVSIISHTTGDATDAMRAVAQVAARPFTAGGGESVGGETAPPHIIEDTAGHIAMKKLLTNDVTRLAAGQIVLFSRILLDILPVGFLKTWAACNRGCFVLIALLEVGDSQVTARVKDELAPLKVALERVDFKGAQVLLSKL